MSSPAGRRHDDRDRQREKDKQKDRNREREKERDRERDRMRESAPHRRTPGPNAARLGSPFVPHSTPRFAGGGAFPFAPPNGRFSMPGAMHPGPFSRGPTPRPPMTPGPGLYPSLNPLRRAYSPHRNAMGGGIPGFFPLGGRFPQLQHQYPWGAGLTYPYPIIPHVAAALGLREGEMIALDADFSNGDVTLFARGSLNEPPVAFIVNSTILVMSCAYFATNLAEISLQPSQNQIPLEGVPAPQLWVFLRFLHVGSPRFSLLSTKAPFTPDDYEAVHHLLTHFGGEPYIAQFLRDWLRPEELIAQLGDSPPLEEVLYVCEIAEMLRCPPLWNALLCGDLGGRHHGWGVLHDPWGLNSQDAARFPGAVRVLLMWSRAKAMLKVSGNMLKIGYSGDRIGLWGADKDPIMLLPTIERGS